MHNLHLAMWDEGLITPPGDLAISFTQSEWNTELPIGSEAEVSGTWSNSNASPVQEIWIEIGGERLEAIVDAGDLSRTGTDFAFSASTSSIALKHTDQVATIYIRRGVAVTSDTIIIRVPGSDPLRNLVGHPTQAAQPWTFTAGQPAWQDESALALESPELVKSMTGLNGHVNIATTDRVIELNEASAGKYYRPRFGISIPAGTVVTITQTHVFDNGDPDDVYVDTFTGPIDFTGQQDEATITMPEVLTSTGDTLRYAIRSNVVTDTPVWQYTDMTESASAQASPAATTLFVNADSDQKPLGNNNTAVVGDPTKPFASLWYIRQNLHLVANGTAESPTRIWLARGSDFRYESIGGQPGDILWLLDKEHVIVEPWEGTSGQAPIVNGMDEQPYSNVMASELGRGRGDRGLIELKNCVSCEVRGVISRDSKFVGASVRNSTDPAMSRTSQNNRFVGIRVESSGADAFILQGVNGNNYSGTPAYDDGSVLLDCVAVNANWEMQNQPFHQTNYPGGLATFPTTGDPLVLYADTSDPDPEKVEKYRWYTPSNSYVQPAGPSTGQAITTVRAQNFRIERPLVYSHNKEGIDCIKSRLGVVIDGNVHSRNPLTNYPDPTGSAYYVDASNEVCEFIRFVRCKGSKDSSIFTIGAESGGAVSEIWFESCLGFEAFANVAGLTGTAASIVNNCGMENCTLVAENGQYAFAATSSGTVTLFTMRGIISQGDRTGLWNDPNNHGNGAWHNHSAEYCLFHHTGGVAAAPGHVAHAIVGDPLFVDPSNGDYRVQAGSPAIGAIPTPYRSFDFDGKRVPPEGPDTIGAYYVSP